MKDCEVQNRIFIFDCELKASYSFGLHYDCNMEQPVACNFITSFERLSKLLTICGISLFYLYLPGLERLLELLFLVCLLAFPPLVFLLNLSNELCTAMES